MMFSLSFVGGSKSAEGGPNPLGHRHTFPMSKSSIKTKTVLTTTDMTESIELQAFKRPNDGYKVTVSISLFIFVVLS